MTTKTRAPKRAAILYSANTEQSFVSAIPKILHTVLGTPLLGYAAQQAQAIACDHVLIPQPGSVRNAALLEALGAFGRVIKTRSTALDKVLSAALAELPKDVTELLVIPADMPFLECDVLADLHEQMQAEGALLALLAPAAQHGSGGGCGGGSCGGCGGHDDAAESPQQEEIWPPLAQLTAPVFFCQRKLLEDLLVDKKVRLRGTLIEKLYLLALQKGEATVVEADSSELFRVDNRFDLALAVQYMRAGINQSHMLAGVSFDDPETTVVEAPVELGIDVQLGTGVQIRGTSSIADGVIVEPYCIIIDSHIEAGARIRSFSHLEGAVVRSGAIVGPYARLRPLADIGPGAHIGNFVEVKKSIIEAGAKANHLAYLGDARVGSGANIGAGTITCNYDGVAKHPTDIGKNVFVGSNSTLVAPIVLHDGAYVAAGSTLTQDVPADALAFGRAHQSNKEGLAARLRNRMQLRAGKNTKKTKKK